MNRTWKLSLAIILASIGLVFELIKRTPPNSMDPEPAANLEDIRPISISHKASPASQNLKALRPSLPRPLRVRAELNPTSINQGETLVLEAKEDATDRFTVAGRADESDSAQGQQEAKKKEDDDNMEDYFDEKTGEFKKRKKVAKNKDKNNKDKDGDNDNKDDGETDSDEKKPDETEVAEGENAPPSPVTPEDPHTTFSDNTITGINTTPPRNTTSPTMPPASNQKDFEQWKKILLGNPDVKAIESFVQAYKTQQISKENFYKLIGLMLQAEKLDIRQLAILALTKTPSDSSFLALVNLLQQTPQDAPLFSTLDMALNTYLEIDNLPILEKILTSSTSLFAVIYATQKIEQAALRYLQTQQDPTITQASVPTFQRFLSVLQNLNQPTQDPSLTPYLLATLGQLQNLLAPHT